MSRQLTITDRVDTMLLPHESNIASLLGDVVDPDKFKAAVIVACQKNPDILRCEQQSVVRACMLCAQDGLMPDGRLAAIVPYNESRKVNGNWEKLKVANYMPMVAGILKRARDFSDFHTIVCEIVCANDDFRRTAGDDPRIDHSFPPLGQERGEIVGAYAIFKDKSNRVIHREVIDKSDLQKIRSVSKAKDKVWGPWEGEMAKKTAIRRGAKRIPMSDELRAIVERDDQLVDLDITPQRPSLQARLSARKHIEPVDEGFDADNIQKQLTQDRSADPDEITPEGEQQQSDNKKVLSEAPSEASGKQDNALATLTEGQLELLTTIEEALSGCRTAKDIDAVLSEYGQDVLDAGEMFQTLANKAVYQRRADLGRELQQ